MTGHTFKYTQTAYKATFQFIYKRQKVQLGVLTKKFIKDPMWLLLTLVKIEREFTEKSMKDPVWQCRAVELFGDNTVSDVRTVLFWVVLVKDQTELVRNPYSR